MSSFKFEVVIRERGTSVQPQIWVTLVTFFVAENNEFGFIYVVFISAEKLVKNSNVSYD